MFPPLYDILEIMKPCYKRGDFVLASGKKSNELIDVKVAALQPGFFTQLAHLIMESVSSKCGMKPGSDYSGIAGVAVGGIPLAHELSGYLYCFKGFHIPYLIVRKEAKGHGSGSLIDGTENISTGSSILVVEDVVTTGASTMKTVNALRDNGYKVSCVVAVVDREEGGRAMLEENGLKFCSLTTLREIRNHLGYE